MTPSESASASFGIGLAVARLWGRPSCRLLRPPLIDTDQLWNHPRASQTPSKLGCFGSLWPKISFERPQESWVPPQASTEVLLSLTPRSALTKKSFYHPHLSRRTEHYPTLLPLPWLSMLFGTDFKVLVLVLKCLHGLFTTDLLSPYQPSPALRSTEAGFKCTSGSFKTHTEASFSYYGPSYGTGCSSLRDPETTS